MASKFQATVVSNEYINAVADSVDTGKPIAYSGVVASSTVFTDEQLKTLDYAGAQSANKEVTSVVTSSYLKKGSNTIVIEVNLSNENLSTDFQWSSVLIYATYNGNNILVAVLRLVTTELFPAYDGNSIVSVGVDLFISVDKTSAANISVNGAGYATIDTVNQLRNYVDNDFNATIIRSDEDGVLNGSYSFSKAINALVGINGALNTRFATFTDFNDVTENVPIYSGFWAIPGPSGILNGPYGTVTRSAYVMIQTSGWNNSGSIIYFELQTKSLYVGYINSAKITWVKISDDGTVIHNIGNESADGIKTFIKQIIAQAGVKGNLQGNADTATKLATSRKLGGQPFDGTSDINLPGVNATGNQNTTGNAGTATKLQTSRKIAGVSFDGTSDIDLAGVNKIGDQDTTGKAASADALNTRQATFTDLATVAANMVTYAGNWYINNTSLNNSPVSGNVWVLIEVIIGNGYDSGIIRFTKYNSNSTYYTAVNRGLIVGWAKVSDDNKVVHNYGNEIVDGNKTFTGNNNFNGPTTLQAGNYGLRVTNTGIQKTSDGGTTWVNI